MEASRLPHSLVPPASDAPRIGIFARERGFELAGPLGFEPSILVGGRDLNDTIRVFHGDFQRETPGGECLPYSSIRIFAEFF